MKIVINTPAGKVGRTTAERLLAEKHQIVIISRNPDKVSGLLNQGASLVEGSLDDPSVLAKAFEGADCLFWVTPPNYFNPAYGCWVSETANLAATTARKNGIRKVALLSSTGAQTGPGSGPIGALLEVETAFKPMIPHVTILRPGFFMENFLSHLFTITHFNVIFGCNPAALKIPMVATVDVGNKAADIILENEFNGVKYQGVHGPKDINFIEAAGVLSESLGREMSYVEITPERARQSMLEQGIPAHIAALLTQMNDAIQSGKIRAAEHRDFTTTTPTTLASFSDRVLLPAIFEWNRHNKKSVERSS